MQLSAGVIVFFSSFHDSFFFNSKLLAVSFLNGVMSLAVFQIASGAGEHRKRANLLLFQQIAKHFLLYSDSGIITKPKISPSFTISLNPPEFLFKCGCIFTRCSLAFTYVHEKGGFCGWDVKMSAPGPTCGSGRYAPDRGCQLS